MFWLLILISAIAVASAALGGYAVWFKVLQFGLLAAALTIAGLVIALLWRKIFGR